MGQIHPRITPTRQRFLEELERMGVGEPKVAGRARHNCLKLGWAQGVYELPDGRKLTSSEFDAEFPPRSDRWRDVKFVGVTMTEAGRDALRQAR